ncbi:inhibitor of the pro-sigma K processing machinery [Caminicella sporogenes DSM 14501]|uniref:Inhibitor of the pro-sigma K processing machinery n=1 Tax=Caminicella sporogenes DSM 14501 TaxID=1121266 RepID=A0A1M6SB18_9FIRM|nr:pro-sigmaK processing inhibitor BofA family protein [Caminicella sporogenes]RKD26937.1 SigmaK-factor processing regulatory BofA [Caminicella sporogenes]WIF95922.1 pro-sigmaK processing inhibitor BofA family protein [Caminicella sporogenes]SHK41905.1 inhibitor of the pro-sigma K processing machinery [Caminicella sporogenes DSM 14501]
MSIGIELSVIFAYALGLILLYIIGYVLLFPIRLIIKLIYNGIIGGILLLIVNFIGQFWGFSIIINPITALIAGFLGVPGVIMMLILKWIL